MLWSQLYINEMKEQLQSRHTTEMYPKKVMHIANWCINLWSKGIAIPTHNIMSCTCFALGFIYKVLSECSRWMYVGAQHLDYIAITICTYSRTNKCNNYLWHSTYWCYYYVNGSITCNMCIHDLPDMNVLIPRASGIHIRKIPLMSMLQLLHVTYVCMFILKIPPLKLFITYNWVNKQDIGQGGRVTVDQLNHCHFYCIWKQIMHSL